MTGMLGHCSSTTPCRVGHARTTDRCALLPDMTAESAARVSKRWDQPWRGSSSHTGTSGSRRRSGLAGVYCLKHGASSHRSSGRSVVNHCSPAHARRPAGERSCESALTSVNRIGSGWTARLTAAPITLHPAPIATTGLPNSVKPRSGKSLIHVPSATCASKSTVQSLASRGNGRSSSHAAPSTDLAAGSRRRSGSHLTQRISGDLSISLTYPHFTNACPDQDAERRLSGRLRDAVSGHAQQTKRRGRGQPADDPGGSRDRRAHLPARVSP